MPLIPILGILCCLMLMFSLPADNWWRLLAWLLIGFVIYFLYGRHHSVMSRSRHLAHEVAKHGASPQQSLHSPHKHPEDED